MIKVNVDEGLAFWSMQKIDFIGVYTAAAKSSSVDHHQTIDYNETHEPKELKSFLKNG